MYAAKKKQSRIKRKMQIKLTESTEYKNSKLKFVQLNFA